MKEKLSIIQIIVNGGDARASSLKAIRSARKGNIEEAENFMERAASSLAKAHEVQTELIQSEARGESIDISLLIIHAQDHLMNALTVNEIALELIEEIKLRIDIEKKLKGDGV